MRDGEGKRVVQYATDEPADFWVIAALVDSIAPYISGANKPVIVVPRYRLEAWQAGERMPSLLQEVFERRGLHEPPWVCWTVRKGAGRKDVAFWIDRRGWKAGLGKDGRRIYGDGLEEDKSYEVREPIQNYS